VGDAKPTTWPDPNIFMLLRRRHVGKILHVILWIAFFSGLTLLVGGMLACLWDEVQICIWPS